MMKYKNVFHAVPATQVNSPFLNSRTLANNDKVERLSANLEILIKGIVSLLWNLFYLLFVLYGL